MSIARAARVARPLIAVLLGACSSTPAAGLDGGLNADAGCVPATAPAPGVVATRSGAVRGQARGAGWAYLGIPYAAPPVGGLRFRPPVAHGCFSGVRDASAFGPACLQLDPTTSNPIGDEDCLTLNLWTPPSPPSGAAPVMVFLHGGGNTGGSASELQAGVALYDPQAIVDAAAAVVVTLEYRLGVMGFFALPALDAESTDHVSGNYGLLDQLAALRWVKDNIAGFGGDPARVMVFGESAGALDVCMLLTSPLSAGLFSAALMESGGCPGPSLAQAEAQDGALLATAGCGGAADVAACLRAIPGPTLTKALPGVVSVTGLDAGTKYGPVVDGVVLPGAPLDRIRAGQHQHVPFIIGSNADETSRQVPAVPSAQAYADLVHATFGKAVGDRILAEYPAGDFATPRAALVAATTDARFVCPSRQIARAVRGAQTQPVHRYFFTHALEGSPLRAFGAWHGLELLWVFDHLTLGGYQPSAGETALSAAMVGYWSNLAATSDPNGGGPPLWPPYDPAADSYLQLDDAITAGSGLRTAHCDFWDTF